MGPLNGQLGWVDHDTQEDLRLTSIDGATAVTVLAAQAQYGAEIPVTIGRHFELSYEFKQNVITGSTGVENVLIGLYTDSDSVWEVSLDYAGSSGSDWSLLLPGDFIGNARVATAGAWQPVRLIVNGQSYTLLVNGVAVAFGTAPNDWVASMIARVVVQYAKDDGAANNIAIRKLVLTAYH